MWEGGDQTSGSAGDGDCCAWLRCLLEQAERSGRLQEHLKALGVDLSELKKCIERHSRRPREGLPEARAVLRPVGEPVKLPELPEVQRWVAALASAPSEDTPLLKSAETQPVARKPKREPTVGNLFVLPGAPEENPPSPKGKPKKPR